MEKVLGGPEGIITVLVQQSNGESTVFLLSQDPLTKGGSKIIVEQVNPMGKIIFISGTWNRAKKQISSRNCFCRYVGYSIILDGGENHPA